MPNVSTYIRTKDLSKYLAIQEKGEWAEFIHKALNGQYQYKKDDVVSGFVVDKTKVGTAETSIRPAVFKPTKTPEDAVEAVKQVFPQAKEIVKTCRIHGTPLTKYDRCTQRGCKYA